MAGTTLASGRAAADQVMVATFGATVKSTRDSGLAIKSMASVSMTLQMVAPTGVGIAMTSNMGSLSL